MEVRRVTFEEELARHGRFLFTNVGGSMLPLLRESRDLMLIERRPTDAEGRALRCRKYDAVLYRRGESYILHRVLKVLPDGYVICGDNNWRREYDIRDPQIIGVMTAFVRDGVETPVTNRWYRAYVHLWCDLYPVRAAILFGRDALSRLKRRVWRKR